MNSLQATWLNRLASNSPVEFAMIFAEFKACHSGVGTVTEGVETLATVGVHQEAEVDVARFSAMAGRVSASLSKQRS